MSLYLLSCIRSEVFTLYSDLKAMKKLLKPLLKPLIILTILWVGMFSAGVYSEIEENSVSLAPVKCLPYKNTQPLCLFTNPEDLAVLPNNNILIVSEFGDSHGTRPGALVFFDIAKQQRWLAFTGGDAIAPNEYWGASSCAEPPGKAFSPHGIDLSQRSDGRWQLLVVQHGGRESIEFFEVTSVTGNLQLVWRGCAIAPEKAMLNSVAAGGHGEFFTTKINSTDNGWENSELDPNEPTGLVFRWNKESGFEPISGSEGVMLNGIAVAPNGTTLYVVYSGERRLKKIDAVTGAVLVSTNLPSADNIKWSADGKTLLAASFVGSEGGDVFAACMSPGIELCPIAFAIIELDPETLSKQTLFENPDAPMGAGTVGMKVGSQLFIGSFASNRLLQVDLEKLDLETMK